MTLPATMTSPIPLAAQETIAFIGDSITEQNLYTAFVETFLISRLPAQQLRFWNLGWGGDVAPGGHGRFVRDCLGLRPSTVVVNFGMNDGTYCPPKAEITERWFAGIKALVQDIRAIGARPVLMSTNPVDEGDRAFLCRYNETLGQFAHTLRAYAATESIPLIDLFPEVLAVQERAKRAQAGFTMIPDGVHPNPVGHLVMAYTALRRFALPTSLGRLKVSPTGITTDGPARISGVRIGERAIECDLELPFIPFWVPPEAREALALVPFQQDLNHFVLSAAGWPTDCFLSLVIDQQEVTVMTPSQQQEGLDLSLIDQAPWASQGQQLWKQAQQRYAMHALAWRRLALEDPVQAQSLPSHARLLTAMAEYLSDGATMLREIALPRRYHLRLEISREIMLRSADCSPLYPFAADSESDFLRAHPPESPTTAVAWTRILWKAHAIDLGAHFGGPSNCVCYLRIDLEADVASTVRMLLGSDDGLSVILNGRRLLDRNVFRGCILGDDTLDVELPAGRSRLLLRVTQGGGGYAAALRLLLLTGGPVRQCFPDSAGP